MGWGGEEGDWEVLKDLDFGEERAAVPTSLFILISSFSPEVRVAVGVQIPGWAGTCWGGPAGALGPGSSNSPAMCVERLEEAALSLLGRNGPVSPGRSEDVGRETQQHGVKLGREPESVGLCSWVDMPWGLGPYLIPRAWCLCVPVPLPAAPAGSQEGCLRKGLISGPA